MLQVFDRVLTSRSNETLVMLILISLFLLGINGLLDGLRSKLLIRFAVVVEKLLGTDVLEMTLKSANRADIPKNGLEDVRTIQSFLCGRGIKAFTELPWIPFFFGLFFLFSPLLALIALIATGLLLVLTGIEERITSGRQKQSNDMLRQTSSFANAALLNAEVVSVLGMQAEVAARWSTLNDGYLDHTAAANKSSSQVQAAAKLVRFVAQVLCMGAAAYLIINNHAVTPGIMVASTIILGRVMAPIDHVIGAWKAFINVREAYRRLDRLFAEARANESDILLPEPRGKLVAERLLFFIYWDHYILNGIDFSLDPGESLGVIGPSASGKTSLARLLVGYYKASDGYVRLDGADVHDWAQGDLGRYIGYLPQSVTLFPGTVAENIVRMGDAKACSARIIEAAQRARIHEMILTLPNGYDTVVGDGGASLISGGQRQVIALARALYGNLRLVVLDEPNANLDSQSELALIEIISNLKKEGVTTVIITHKPSVIKDVDKLLVLRRGRQLMFGPNHEVLKALNTAPRELPVASDAGSDATNGRAHSG
ncbi:MAG: type I secretion system permease/ATPase [Burkholderiales bacterium]